MTCFQGKGDQPASFNLKRTGVIKAIRVKHISGMIGCGGVADNYWGCSHELNKLRLIITSVNRYLLYPKESTGDSDQPANQKYNVYSKELILNFNRKFYRGTKGEILNIWFDEDFRNEFEEDNVGSVCVKIDVLY